MTDRFLRACRREPVDRTPVWLLRQTGRWLPDYRDLRSRHPLRAILASPDLIVEATLLPLHHLAVDAAPVFTEPRLLLDALGLQSGGWDADGDRPSRPAPGAASRRELLAEIERLRPIEARESSVLRPTLDAIRRLREGLRGPTVLGMSAAPFSLAAYAIEGGAPRSFDATRTMMYAEPEAWRGLCEALAATVADWLMAQVEAGAEAIQMADAWTHVLTAEEYRAYALPYSRAVLERVAPSGVATIHYGAGAAVLEGLAEAGGDVIGIDWRIPLDEAWERVGADRAIQGNLAPTALVAPFEQMLEAAGEVLDRADGRPGHIFNLGHGLLATTPPEHVSALVRYVQMQTEV